MKLAVPATPADAKGLLAAAIRDPDPVVVLEPKLHYRTVKEEVPDGEHVVPLGEARIAREGTDLTIVAYGAMVHVARRAAEAEPPADVGLLFEHALADPPESFQHDLAELRRILGG